MINGLQRIVNYIDQLNSFLKGLRPVNFHSDALLLSQLFKLWLSLNLEHQVFKIFP